MNWELVWETLNSIGTFLARNETLAIVAPFTILLITITLAVRRSIGFFAMVALLLFALASGLAIMNYQTVREWAKNDIPEEHYLGIQESIGEFHEEMIDALDRIEERLSELEEEKEAFQQVAHSTSYLLQRIEKQEERIQQLQERKKEEKASIATILPE